MSHTDVWAAAAFATAKTGRSGASPRLFRELISVWDCGASPSRGDRYEADDGIYGPGDDRSILRKGL